MESNVPRGLSSEFRERADRVFGSLPKIEATPSESGSVDDRSKCGSYVGDVKYKGRAHRVLLNPTRSRHGARFTPGYIKHPEKWTKYDLKEDGTEQMEGMSADQMNRAAALQFLQERQSLADSELTDEKVMFRRPKNSKRVLSNTSTDTTTRAGGIHVMPEFQFGKKREKVNSVTAAVDPPASCHSVKLSHLEEEGRSE